MYLVILVTRNSANWLIQLTASTDTWQCGIVSIEWKAIYLYNKNEIQARSKYSYHCVGINFI